MTARIADPLTEENPHPVFWYSARGKPVYANLAARLLLEGKDYPPDQGSEWHRVLKTALESWRNQRIECRMQGRWYDVRFVPQFKDRRVRVYACDISSWKKGAGSGWNPLKNELFKTLMDNIPGEVFVFDAAFRMRYANGILQKMLGPPRGRKCERYFSERERYFSEKRFGRVLRGKRTRWEWHFPGKKRILKLAGIPVPAGGETWGLVIAHDHTREKQLESRLHRSNETLSEITRVRAEDLLQHKKEVQRFKRLSDIGMLGATVAHELRNPLGVIRTAVFNIQRKRTNTGIDRHLDNIEKKIVESDQIINNLLFYARLKKPVFEPMNLSTAMKESTAAVKDRFSESRVSVRTINRLGARFMIDADDYQLREVFTNLLNNAFQAIGGEKGRVEITLARSRKEGVTIRVRDTGCGIVPEDREKVFDPFFTRKSKGTGLGLSLCRDVIEMHGGRIALQSKPGEGTAVTVVLPAENAARGASSSRKKSAGTGGGESVAGEKRPSRVTPSRRKKSRKKDAS